MRKRIMCTLVGAVLGLSLAVPVSAAEETGTIRLDLDAGELPVINGEVTLYRVGEEMPGGYRLVTEFGGGIVQEPDARSPHLAQWLSQMARDGGATLLLDADGKAVFEGLSHGLYLLVQTQRMDGFYPFRPFLVTVPMDGDYDIFIEPMTQPIVLTPTPSTGQDPLIYGAALVLWVSGFSLVLCLNVALRRRKQRKALDITEKDSKNH